MLMTPQFKTLQKKMLRKASSAAPKKKTCPKCKRTRDVKKYFGFRTQHAKNGEPQRSMPQSYCVECRRGDGQAASH